MTAALGSLVFPGCPAQGVGDPCVPEEEYSQTFSGFAVREVNTESRSFQCQSRVCLVNQFQGRVSCPYGQPAGGADCKLPGGDAAVTVAVKPQLLERRAEDAVYCSCRCSGPDPDARYCECPSGYACTELVPELVNRRAQLLGGYCTRAGTSHPPSGVSPTQVCDRALANCGPE